ncbi:MAG: tetratricopeptide repeat protein [Candidatus Aceula lacicola]|nr:tetratricopeptide repeat protein [Candidatus Aceula lacicola]
MQKSFFPDKKNQVILTYVILSFLVILTFSPCFNAGKVNWDDDNHLFANLAIKTIPLDGVMQGMKNIFTQKVNGTYHPLTTLSFAVEYIFARENPFLYHFNNIILHLLVSILVFIFARKIGISIVASGIVATIFAIHPTRVESVAWIAERKDVLYAFFYMLALNVYWKYLTSKKRKFYFFAIGFGLLSILAKAMALSLPLILLLCDWFYTKKITKKALLEKIPFFIIAIGISFITYTGYARIPESSFYEGVLLWFWTLTFYLKKFIYPGILVALYKVPQPIVLKNFAYSFSFIIFFGVSSILCFFRRYRWLLFSFAFYFLSIFFLMRFDSGFDTNVVADRFMYLPSLGFSFVIGFCIDRFLAIRKNLLTKTLKIIGAFALIVLIVLMSFKTFQSCKVWNSGVSLWTYQSQNNPDNPVILNNLATAIVEQVGESVFWTDLKEYKKKTGGFLDNIEIERFDEKLKNLDQIENSAEKVFVLLKRASELEPYIPEPIFNLGVFSAHLGLHDQAIELYKETISSFPDFMRTYFYLARLYRTLGEDDKAIDNYWKTLYFQPTVRWVYASIIDEYNLAIEEKRKNGKDAKKYEKAREQALVLFRDLTLERMFGDADYENTANVYEDIRDFASAEVAYKKALGRKDAPRTLLALGNVYLQQEKSKEAINIFEKILKIDPENKKAFFNLGVAYNQNGNSLKAIECYDKTLEIDDKNSKAYFNLGYVYENIGEDKKAIFYYQKAIELDDVYSDAYYNIGNIYIKNMDADKAIEFYRKAVDANPNHIDALVNLSTLLFYQKEFGEAIVFLDRAQNLGHEPSQRYLKEIEKYRE